MKKISVLACLLLAAASAHPRITEAQSVFRSTQSANLPTAAQLNGGNWMFEISHRFTPISGGADQFWGLDGPVINRLGLTFAPDDRLMVGVLRSNQADNLELNAKFRGFAVEAGAVPIEVSAQGGIAWNTEISANVFPGGELTDNEMQAYVQLIANALLGDRVALGLVPTFLRNPRILDVEAETAFVMGLNGQVYFNPTWSFLAEWVISEARTGLENDSGAFGFEIRTRGHFFKLLVTNQQQLNPTQVLAGTSADFTDTDFWGFGFNITRLLPF